MQYFKYGAVQSPLDGYDGYSSLIRLDPCLYYMIDYYSTTITSHIRNAWNYYVNILGKTELIDKPVAYNLPYDPLPLEQSTFFEFPLLAIYRQTNKYEFKTFVYDHIISRFNLVYIMPPLDAAATEILTPFLAHIARVVQDKTESNADPTYSNNENVWMKAGIEQIKVLSAEFGKIPNINSNMHFPAVSIEIEAIERLNTVSLNYDEFTDVTADIYTKQDNQEELKIISLLKEFE